MQATRRGFLKGMGLATIAGAFCYVEAKPKPFTFPTAIETAKELPQELEASGYGIEQQLVWASLSQPEMFVSSGEQPSVTLTPGLWRIAANFDARGTTTVKLTAGENVIALATFDGDPIMSRMMSMDHHLAVKDETTLSLDNRGTVMATKLA